VLAVEVEHVTNPTVLNLEISTTLEVKVFINGFPDLVPSARNFSAVVAASRINISPPVKRASPGRTAFKLLLEITVLVLPSNC